MDAAQQPDLARRIEALKDNPALDRGVDLLDAAAARLMDATGVRQAFEAAEVTGSPLHPALVHLPIGGAISAAVTDLLGMRPAACALTGFTMITAAVSAAAGLHDYSEIEDRPARRLAFAHFASAITGSALITTSLVARAGGSRGAARLLLWGGCAAYGVAGLLGGHLVYGGSAEEDADESAPDETAAFWGE